MARKLMIPLGVAVAALAIGGMLGAYWYKGRLQTMTYFSVHQPFYALTKARQPVVMLGDSLIAAAPWNEMTACPNVVNRGVPGDTAADVLGRIDDVVVLKPGAVFLMVGINDVKRGVQAAKTAEQIAQIARRLPNTPVLVHLVPPVASSVDGGDAIAKAIAALNAAIADALRPLAHVQLIDLRPRLAATDGFLKPALTVDGIHFSAAGYALWRDAIEPSILRHCAVVNVR